MLQIPALLTAAVLAAPLALSLFATTAHASGTVAIASDIPAQVPAGTLVGPTAAGNSLTIVLTLPSRDAAGLAAFVRAVSTPGNAQFRHYLTPAQFAARFGGNAQDYAALIAWAQANKLTINEQSIGRTVLSLTGSVARIGALLGVVINDYRAPDGHVYFAAANTPSLPADLARRVSGVIGLSGYTHYAPLVRIKPASVPSRPQALGSGPHGAYSASDLRGIYNVPAQLPGQKEVLAVFEQGGFTADDVTKYLTENKLPNVPVVVRGVNGYNGSVGDPRVEAEAVLDIDMIVGINPAAAKVIVYEDGAATLGVALVEGLTAIANDNKARTVSISYGLDEAIMGSTQIAAENTLFEQLTGEGVSVFASAGDNGAYGDSDTLNVLDPSSQPFVTAVGGTTLFSNNGQYSAELAWNWLNLGLGATGGGVSDIWPIPFYQSAYGTGLVTQNGGSAAFRNVPDVAAVGDSVTGVSIYSKINGGWLTVGGTSAASPIWAGFLSVVDAAQSSLGLGHIGFFNPELYAFGVASPGAFQQEDFNDVTDGNNGDPAQFSGLPGYLAGWGYDNTTGFGSMNGAAFVADLSLMTAQLGTNPPAAPTNLKARASSSSITLTWQGAPGEAYLVSGFNPQTYVLAPVQVLHGTSASWSNLPANTMYQMSVYALTAGGATQSAPLTVKTAK